jgi:hypothetical protein
VRSAKSRNAVLGRAAHNERLSNLALTLLRWLQFKLEPDLDQQIKDPHKNFSRQRCFLSGFHAIPLPAPADVRNVRLWSGSANNDDLFLTYVNTPNN